MKNLVANLKKTIKKIPFFVSGLYRLRHYINYYIKADYGGLTNGELAVFTAIKDDVKILFDVGARFNSDYCRIADGNQMAFYLFEPNPRFYRKLLANIREYSEKNTIFTFNYGLADKEGECLYYEDTQSFASNQAGLQSRIPAKRLKISTLSLVCEIEQVRKIDFLKTDVESLDYNVLMGGKDIIQSTCKYCQFELGFGGDFGGQVTTPEHYYEYFRDKFNLYLIKDDAHPIFSDNPALPVLTLCTSDFLQTLKPYIYKGYGVNLFAVRKAIPVPQALQSLMHS